MSNWNDPLKIDVQKQLSVALQALPSDSHFASILQNLQPDGTCLPTISKLLLEPSLTLLLKLAFQPLLVDLCARWLDDGEDLDKKIDAFALLVEVHEEIAAYVLCSPR
jgi:midasin